MAICTLFVLVMVFLLLSTLQGREQGETIQYGTIVCYRADTHHDDCECGLEHDRYCLDMERIK